VRRPDCSDVGILVGFGYWLGLLALEFCFAFQCWIFDLALNEISSVFDSESLLNPNSATCSSCIVLNVLGIPLLAGDLKHEVANNALQS
jgi:hypothetical protein